MTASYSGSAYPAKSAFADVTLLVGRIMLVVIFLASGASKFADIAGTAGYIASKGLPYSTALAVLSGIVEVGGGLLIIVGWQTRLVSIALMLFTLVAAYYFHDFWRMAPGAEQIDTMVHAMKNLSIAGAFLMLAGSGAGRYSVDGRRR
jgi:putative oxidoreductase